MYAPIFELLFFTYDLLLITSVCPPKISLLCFSRLADGMILLSNSKISMSFPSNNIFFCLKLLFEFIDFVSSDWLWIERLLLREFGRDDRFCLIFYTYFTRFRIRFIFSCCSMMKLPCWMNSLSSALLVERDLLLYYFTFSAFLRIISVLSVSLKFFSVMFMTF